MSVEAVQAKLAGVGVGDIVFVGNGRDVSRPAQVEKVGKIHLIADGEKYAIDSGLKAGKPERGMGFTRARPYSDALNEAWELHRLKWAFEKELALFRATPEKMTKDRIQAVLHAMNPEAWK